MKFGGRFDLNGVPPDDAWVVLSDPVTVRDALPGCHSLTRIDDDSFDPEAFEPDEDAPVLSDADPDVVAARRFEEGETYAARMQVGAGSVNPRFETRVTIVERSFPRMVATGTGDASDSAFSMRSWMELSETDAGTLVEWGTESDVSGRIAQLGGRALEPVANAIVDSFFENVEAQLRDAAPRDRGITTRIRNLMRP